MAHLGDRSVSDLRLTVREQMAVDLRDSGLKNADIAVAMDVSRTTVVKYVSMGRAKLASAADLVDARERMMAPRRGTRPSVARGAKRMGRID